MSRVVVAEKISESGIAALAKTCEVVDAVDWSREELLGGLAGAAALIVRSATQVDAQMIAAGESLEVIGRAGIGVDNIDLDAATAAGVLVVNAPDSNTISAAEHTMALLLAQARRIPEADASLRGGAWERAKFKGVELHGKTLGVLGLGKIGTLVAQRAAAFGMRITAYDPYVSDERAHRIGVDLGTLEEVLRDADFVTVHLPRTRETEGLISKETLAAMKPGARIINVARGGLVDEEALAESIEAGHIAGAAFDVFATEPVTDSPFFAMPEVVVTPHLGASTREAQDKAGLSVAEAVAAALAGELVPSAVNVDLGARVTDEVRPFLHLAELLGRIFTGFARGLPTELEVTSMGQLALEPSRAVMLSALKGTLDGVIDDPVSFVNAPLIAQSHGIRVSESAQETSVDYQSLVILSGVVADRDRLMAGTMMEKKGPVLVEVDDYEIELPITDYMLLVRNDDVPGVIGRVGTAIGDLGINISDMAVGRNQGGQAMMGLSLDAAISPEGIEQLAKLDGVAAIRFIDLT
jgi:D-3-phosphoglycerate dehydrogenase